MHNKTFWWGERVLHRSAEYFLYSKICFGAALSSRNIAICTTRSTMWKILVNEGKTLMTKGKTLVTEGK